MRLFRRILVVVAVIALLAALLLPGYVGRLVRDLSEQQLALLDRGTADAGFLTEQADAGWFSSRYRHRVVTEPEALEGWLGQLFASDVFADQPALSIDTELHQGPVALGALKYTWRALWPAWSRSRSTLTLDTGRELVELPLVIDTTIGITGKHTSLVSATAFDTGWKLESLRMAAATGALGITTGADGRLRHVAAAGSTVAFAKDQNELDADEIVLDVDLARADESALDLTFNARGLALRGVGSAQRFERIDLKLGVDGDRIGLSVNANRDVPEAATLDLLLRLDGVDAALRERWLTDYQRRGFVDWERWLYELAANNGELVVESANGSLNGDAFSLSGELALRPSPAAVNEVFAAATGNAELRLAGGLVRAMVRSGQAIPWLSYLARDGDDYLMVAKLDAGQLDLNGAVFPMTANTDQSPENRSGNSDQR
ncbi:MAG: DUF945 family protein [Pseudomonadota bacterium]